MLKRSFATAITLVALTLPAISQQELKAAMVAAMGEAIEDARYPDILAKYCLLYTSDAADE